MIKGRSLLPLLLASFHLTTKNYYKTCHIPQISKKKKKIYTKFLFRSRIIFQKASGNLHQKFFAKAHESSRFLNDAITALACHFLKRLVCISSRLWSFDAFLCQPNERSSYKRGNFQTFLRHLEHHLKGYAMLSCRVRQKKAIKSTFFARKCRNWIFKNSIVFPSAFKNSTGTRECFRL